MQFVPHTPFLLKDFSPNWRLKTRLPVYDQKRGQCQIVFVFEHVAGLCQTDRRSKCKRCTGAGVYGYGMDMDQHEVGCTNHVVTSLEP